MNEISGLGRNKSGTNLDKIIDKMGNEFSNLETAEFMNQYYTEAGPN